MMISLLPETQAKVREEVANLYHGRVGGLSIFFEKLVRDYFERQEKEAKKRKP